MVEKDSPPTSFLSTPSGSSHSSGGPASLNRSSIGALRQQETGSGRGNVSTHGQYQTSTPGNAGTKFGTGQTSIPGSRTTPASHAPSKYPLQESDTPTSGSGRTPFVHNDAAAAKAVNTSVTSLTSMSSVEDNRLEDGIDKEIGAVANTVKIQVGGGAGGPEGKELAPYDPNLVCPTCGRKFRLGQIQVFRLHAAKCNNKVT